MKNYSSYADLEHSFIIDNQTVFSFPLSCPSWRSTRALLSMPFINYYKKILKVLTNIHLCRLLPVLVLPRHQISVALGRDPILVQVILNQLRLKEREEMSLNRGQDFVVGCGNPAVKTWVHGENRAGALYQTCLQAVFGVCSPSQEIEPAQEPSA